MNTEFVFLIVETIVFFLVMGWLCNPFQIAKTLDWLAGKDSDWKPLKSVCWVYAFFYVHTLRTMLAPVETIPVQLARVVMGLLMIVIIPPVTYHLVWLVAEHIDKDNPLPWATMVPGPRWLNELYEGVYALVVDTVTAMLIYLLRRNKSD